MLFLGTLGRTDGRTDEEGKAAEVADPSDARAPGAGGRTLSIESEVAEKGGRGV